jgi:hypothetical protein
MSDNKMVCIIACVFLLCLTTCSVSEDWKPKKCEAPSATGKP